MPRVYPRRSRQAASSHHRAIDRGFDCRRGSRGWRGRQGDRISDPERYNASEILFQNLAQGRGDCLAVTGPAGHRTYAQLCADAARWGNALLSSARHAIHPTVRPGPPGPAAGAGSSFRRGRARLAPRPALDRRGGLLRLGRHPRCRGPFVADRATGSGRRHSEEPDRLGCRRRRCSVSLQGPTPLGDLFRDLPFDEGDLGDLPSLLTRLRGTEVKIEAVPACMAGS